MLTNAIDLDAYLERIDYPGERNPSLETLKNLHLLHPTTIPFENLSPFLGQAVKLDAGSLQDKLVTGKRGGYCFEHNLLFFHVLRSLGFKVTGLAARVLWNLEENVVLPRTHMLLLVNIDNIDYIADVGFGGLTMTAPLELNSGMEQSSPHETFKLVESDQGFTLYVKLDDSWKPMYGFDLQQQQQADYEMMNWYVSTQPQSRFVNELIAARPENECRHALLNNEYSIYSLDGNPDKKIISNVDDLMVILGTTFRISLTGLPDIEQKLNKIL